MDDDFPGRDNAQPAHAQIEDHGSLLEPRDTGRFQNDSADCTCPDNAENAPAPGAPEIYKREGSIRACDQKIDCRVVDNLEKPLGGAVGQAVVKRRSAVEKNKCAAENREAHNVPGRSAIDGTDNQNDQPPDAQRRPQAVGKTIDYLFTKRVSPHSISPCVLHIHSLRHNCQPKTANSKQKLDEKQTACTISFPHNRRRPAAFCRGTNGDFFAAGNRRFTVPFAGCQVDPAQVKCARG